MSEIKVDTLTGKTTANDITVTVGATATMSLEQGLAKAWASIDADATDHPTLDAFNIASTADIATGVTKITFTNSFSNSFYAVSGAGQAQDESGGDFRMWGRSTISSRQMTSSDFHTDNRTSGAAEKDLIYFGMSAHGDLA